MTLNIPLEDHRIRILQSVDPNYQYSISIVYTSKIGKGFPLSMSFFFWFIDD
jgi:hypothetical protein